MPATTPERAALRRNPTLTPRERQIVELIAQGFDTKQIAAILGIRPATVDARVQGLYRKYGVNRRAGLVWVALARGAEAASVEPAPPSGAIVAPKSSVALVPVATAPARRAAGRGR